MDYDRIIREALAAPALAIACAKRDLAAALRAVVTAAPEAWQVAADAAIADGWSTPDGWDRAFEAVRWAPGSVHVDELDRAIRAVRDAYAAHQEPRRTRARAHRWLLAVESREWTAQGGCTRCWGTGRQKHVFSDDFRPVVEWSACPCNGEGPCSWPERQGLIRRASDTRPEWVAGVPATLQAARDLVEACDRLLAEVNHAAVERTAADLLYALRREQTARRKGDHVRVIRTTKSANNGDEGVVFWVGPEGARLGIRTREGAVVWSTPKSTIVLGGPPAWWAEQEASRKAEGARMVPVRLPVQRLTARGVLARNEWWPRAQVSLSTDGNVIDGIPTWLAAKRGVA